MVLGICMSNVGIKHPSRVGSALVCAEGVSRSNTTFRTVRRRLASCSFSRFMCLKEDGKVGRKEEVRQTETEGEGGNKNKPDVNHHQVAGRRG